MKRILSILLTVCLLGSLVWAHAAEGDARAVIGANLTETEIEQVYRAFGVERGSVTELKLTNDEERALLAGLVDEERIGTNSISCIYIELLPAGSGSVCEVKDNITWCTSEVYLNALVTAGVEDARVVVSAPFAVSGTAALAGVYKAYESITGQELDVTSKQVGTEELVITSDLADEIGSYDASQIVNEIKLVLDETVNMTDDELRTEIRTIAGQYNVTLSDGQTDQLIGLCRSLEGLSSSELVDKVKQVQQTVQRLAEARETAGQVADTVGGVVETVKSILSRALDFLTGLFGSRQ